MLDLQDAEQANAAREVSNRVAGSLELGSRALSLDWRLGPREDRASVRAYVLRRARQPAGIAMFSRRERPLEFRLGEVPLCRVGMIRHWHVGEPGLLLDADENELDVACQKLIAAVVAGIGRGESVFFEGLPQDGPLFRAITAVTRAKSTCLGLHLGLGYDHQFIRMPGSFDEYLSQLGSRSKRSVQYDQRRLLKEMEGEVECVCFDTPESVDRFSRDAEEVSRKTYQWNLLGLGLRNTPEQRESHRYAATQGWLRSFVLYCRGKPAAFMLGHQHGRCYYYDDVGYDPAFARYSVGSVLQLYVLEHLLAREDRPACFDFSTGFGPHKARFSNGSRREVDLLVMRRTAANKVLFASYRANQAFSRMVVGLTEKLGVKERLKRLIRRRSAAAAKAK